MDKIKAKFIDEAMTTDSELNNAVNFLQAQISGTPLITDPMFSAYKQFLAKPGDIFSIAGNATKSIKVYKIGFQSLSATDVYLIKRQPNLGTATTITAHPLSTGTSTAVIKSYAVAPTLGDVIATFESAIFTNDVKWTFDTPITLQAGEELCLNISHPTQVDVSFLFSESV